MKLIGNIEHVLTLLQDGAGLLVVHHGRREQRQARVVMFFVVPTKKSLRESATVLNAAEAVGKLGTIFHGAELTLRVRVVILKSGVKFAVFLQIGPKTGICSKNLCSC